MDAVGLGDGGIGPGPLAIHEHANVLPDPSLVVEHPAEQTRVQPLQRSKHVGDGDSFNGHLAPSAGEFPQRRP